ncbi:uncharacterized membrane protein At4g09580 [Selaginella moellendorffii]|nr:uncharacterized membrane protein At4g09580 [Selaginella moellendorffii]|eukprot:XP_002974093.2 uncharacterized membrane protein At4g09580 [Selaginella moellendorffii]
MRTGSSFLSGYFTLPSIWIPAATAPSTLDPLLQEKGESNSTEEANSDNGEARNESSFPLTRLETMAVVALFTVFVGGLIAIFLTMPDADRDVFKLPRTLEELRKLTEYLSVYAQDHTLQVLLGYVVSYVFLQTFMIPGTILMSLLAGALFGEYYGLLLVVSTATAGACSCYFLSKLVGRPLLNWLWPDKLAFFRDEVAKRKDKLLNYMLFLRITPTLPNTFINVASPIVDIPFDTFFWATAIGLVPAAFVTVRAGLALGELQSLRDLYDLKTIATLFFIGLVSIVPTVFASKPTEQEKENS